MKRYVYDRSRQSRGKRSWFFFNDTATTEIYTLSLHDALPICCSLFPPVPCRTITTGRRAFPDDWGRSEEHTSELQSPYVTSYAFFCLKKHDHVQAPRRGNIYHASAPPPNLALVV